MTETDATKRPLDMPAKFIPYLQKYRLYLLFKDMLKDLIVELPKDHLKHMKIFFAHNMHTSKDIDKVILLVSPDLKIDVPKLVKELIKDLGVFVVTRRCVMDRYEKHDDYAPGCVKPELLSEVTKNMTLKDPVPSAGWLMFDHPCSVREARCLQQDGVLPTVTLDLIPPPPASQPATNDRTPARTFWNQDYEGLKFAYKATLKEVYVEPDDSIERLSTKCFNAVRACAAGAQGPGQGHHVLGAPGVYRVLMIGPRGSGRRTQARMLAAHFGLVYLNYERILGEAKARNDDIGEKLRKYGSSVQLKADIVKRRILQKDCIDHGWVLTGYPLSGQDFEYMDNMPTPPNRVLILNTEMAKCKERAMAIAVDWCTGKRVPRGSGPRVVSAPGDNEAEIDAELDLYFTETLAELRASAGITAVEIDANESNLDAIQIAARTAVISAPSFNIEIPAALRSSFVNVD